MVSSFVSTCAVAAEEHARILVPKSQSQDDQEQEMIPPGPYQLPSCNNIVRQYTRQHDRSMPESPCSHSSSSEILDADNAVNSREDAQVNQMLEEEDEDEDDWDYEHDPAFQQRIYESPRLIVEDDEIFPPKDCHAILYHDPAQRWETISEQAGPHRQDGSTLIIPRYLTPSSLKKGMMSQYFANRVRTLSLWLDHKEDILPQWLDVLGTTFPNLEHLSLSQDMLMGEEEIEVSARMRRLYILYRLPGLLSIDDTEVTHTERSLARPSTPNGERVQRGDWMNKKVSLLDCDENEDKEESDHGAMQQEIHFNKPVESQTRQDVDEDKAALTPRIVAIGNDEGNAAIDTPGESSIEEKESLAAKGLINLTATSPAHSGEKAKERNTDSSLEDNGDDGKEHESKMHSQHLSRQSSAYSSSMAPKVSLASKRKSIAAPSRIIGRRPRDVPLEMNGHTNDGLVDEFQDNLFSQSSAADTLELISVASSQHEWTAACGVFSFRTDRGCTPKLRLNFCGRGKNKRIDNNNNSKQFLLERNTKKIVRANLDRQGSERKHLLSRQEMQSPKADGSISSNAVANVCKMSRSPLRDRSTRSPHEISDNQDTPAFPSSANQKLPPSKSLSSPFPMQFRERTASLQISTAETTLTNKSQHIPAMPSSPRARGSVVMDTITQPLTLTALKPLSAPRRPSVERKTWMTTGANKSNNRGSTSKLVAKGSLPPPCPPSSRRKVVASSLLQHCPHTSLERKEARRARRMERRKRAFQENARSMSVFDDTDDDEDSSSEDNSSEEDDKFDNSYHNGFDKEDNQNSSIHDVSEW